MYIVMKCANCKETVKDGTSYCPVTWGGRHEFEKKIIPTGGRKK